MVNRAGGVQAIYIAYIERVGHKSTTFVILRSPRTKNTENLSSGRPDGRVNAIDQRTLPGFLSIRRVSLLTD